MLDPKLYNALGKVVVLINEVILGQAFWFRCRFDVFQRSHVIPISTDEASWDVQLIGNKMVRNKIRREILHVSIVHCSAEFYTSAPEFAQTLHFYSCRFQRNIASHFSLKRHSGLSWRRRWIVWLSPLLERKSSLFS